MAEKSTKEGKPSREDVIADDVEEQESAAEPAPKKEVLSLIDEKPKRRRRRAVDADAEKESGPPKPSAIQKAKDEAVSLFEESERREQSRAKGGRKKILEDSEIKKRKKGDAAEVLPPISRLKAEEEERGGLKTSLSLLKGKSAAPVDAPPAPEAEVADAPAEEDAGEAAPELEGDGVEAESNIIHIKPPIIVKDLAERMGLKPFMLIKDLIDMEVFANTNQSIEPDIAAKVCEKHGFVFEKEKREKGAGVHKVEEVIEEPELPEEVEEDTLKPRAPVITFMGHVDHGKTSLLDAIRKARVAAGEAGGITQHIGAYMVEHEGHPITFLDTPGHAAFTEMRARGANVTDIVVLVVAADDGMMPQTIEAMNHAKAAGVKIVVALNKIDLPSANPDRVKAQLQEHDLAPEEWGGETSVVEVSATTGQGIDRLLEIMNLEAELLELRANPKGHARAAVIEAKIEAGKGPTATVIVQSGTLRVGTPFICGPFWGKVKLLLDDRGSKVAEAGPSMPVEVLGFSGLPNVGDELVEMDNERAAKRLSDERQELRRKEKLSRPARPTLESILVGGSAGRPVLHLVLKSDVQGSAEAIVGALEEIPQEKITLDILHAAAGAITESDILLASASNGVVIGFNTRVEGKAVKVAKAEEVQIKLFSIIYELIDQVRDAMLGMLAPETRETIIGHAEVKQVFKLTRGRVGGCLVLDGRISRSARARVLRDGQPVYDGALATLRRFQDEVNEVRNGLECGIKLGDFNDYEVGDIIECYELEKLAQSL